MATDKIWRLLFWLTVGIVRLQFQCNKKIGCENSTYAFDMGLSVYPGKDSMRVGDTLWFAVKESTTLRDQLTGNLIDYSGAANLATLMSFHRLSPQDEFTEPSADKFNFLLDQGREVSSLGDQEGECPGRVNRLLKRSIQALSNEKRATEMSNHGMGF
jgi:hypothetical protein